MAWGRELMFIPLQHINEYYVDSLYIYFLEKSFVSGTVLYKLFYVDGDIIAVCFIFILMNKCMRSFPENRSKIKKLWNCQENNKMTNIKSDVKVSTVRRKLWSLVHPMVEVVVHIYVSFCLFLCVRCVYCYCIIIHR